MIKNLLTIALLFLLCFEVSAQLPRSIMKPVQRVSAFDDYDGTIYDEPVEGTRKGLEYLSKSYKLVIVLFKK